MEKKKQLRTVLLKNKPYVQVQERVIFFNEEYPNGKIETKPTFNDKTVSFCAVITPDVKEPERKFTGHSFGILGQEKALEKLETVAVGRALAFMGIGIVEGIASADEMQKFNDSQRLSFEENYKLATKGELICFDCASEIEPYETKTGEARLKCPKSWQHKNFIPREQLKAEVKKITQPF